MIAISLLLRLEIVGSKDRPVAKFTNNLLVSFEHNRMQGSWCMLEAFGLNIAGKPELRGVPFHPEWDQMCDGSQPEAWHLRQGRGKELVCPV